MSSRSESHFSCGPENLRHREHVCGETTNARARGTLRRRRAGESPATFSLVSINRSQKTRAAQLTGSSSHESIDGARAWARGDWLERSTVRPDTLSRRQAEDAAWREGGRLLYLHTHTHRERERERERATERRRDRETERRRDRETQRQRDAETERQRGRGVWRYWHRRPLSRQRGRRGARDVHRRAGLLPAPPHPPRALPGRRWGAGARDASRERRQYIYTYYMDSVVYPPYRPVFGG